MTRLSGWGRYPVRDSEVIAPSRVAAIAALSDQSGMIARGNGRAYGDAAIGTRLTVDLRALDHMQSFDPATGQLTVEAGVQLADIIATFLPRGFFPKVVPGTRYVTVGGAIAADIHGKNHHRDGGFGDHVDSLDLVTAAGEQVTCSRTQNSALFFATIGGMGLTGTIIAATLSLRPVESGWIRQTTVVAPNLSSAMAALDDGDAASYSVAWIDCVARGAALGRSLIFLGEHAARAEVTGADALFPPIAPARLTMPIDLPTRAMNRLTVGAFNELYFRLGARRAGASFLVPIVPYFFPLDGIGAWNRLYGRQGFVQHQCVLPPATAAAALAEILGRIAARGNASFLAVLKKLGPSHGLMSFPMAGYSLALDFAVAPGLLEFLDELDRIVVAAGGRLYLAKDARQSLATFDAGYPAVDRFRAFRREVDPRSHFQSCLAERLAL